MKGSYVLLYLLSVYPTKNLAIFVLIVNFKITVRIHASGYIIRVLNFNKAVQQCDIKIFLNDEPLMDRFYLSKHIEWPQLCGCTEQIHVFSKFLDLEMGRGSKPGIRC